MGTLYIVQCAICQEYPKYLWFLKYLKKKEKKLTMGIRSATNTNTNTNSIWLYKNDRIRILFGLKKHLNTNTNTNSSVNQISKFGLKIHIANNLKSCFITIICYPNNYPQCILVYFWVYFQFSTFCPKMGENLKQI